MLIKEVFDQFLSEQKSKLAPKTYRDYESVIDLFDNQLDGYAWNGIDDGEKAYDEAKKQKKSFINLYDHTHIEDNVGEFLDYFVPRKVMSGDEFILKTCPRVIRKLLKSLGVLFPAACGDVKNIFLVDTPSACGGVVHWAWSKVKAYLRQVKARTVDALYQALAQALDTISPAAMPYTLCDTQGKWLPKREMLYIIQSLSTVTSISWM